MGRHCSTATARGGCADADGLSGACKHQPEKSRFARDAGSYRSARRVDRSSTVDSDLALRAYHRPGRKAVGVYVEAGTGAFKIYDQAGMEVFSRS